MPLMTLLLQALRCSQFKQHVDQSVVHATVYVRRSETLVARRLVLFLTGTTPHHEHSCESLV